MKKILLAAVAVLFAATSFAQTTVNDKVVKVDLGLGSSVGGLPIGVSYEQGVMDLGDGSFITAGGYIGYEQSTDSYGLYDWKLSQLNIMAQGNYYFAPMMEKMDIYAGLRVGYANVSSTWIYADGTKSDYDWGSPFAYSIHVGANYWFSDNMAVNAELGYGIAYLNVGIAYKF